MIKTNILDDVLKSREFLKELGFTQNDTSGFSWYYEDISVTLYLLDYGIYDDVEGKYIQCPNINLSLRWMGNDVQEEHSVLITQNWEVIRRTMLSSSITDLGIKTLNRNIKLYSLLNGVECKFSEGTSISCMALKLNPRLITKLFSK